MHSRHEEVVAECSAALLLQPSHANSLRRRADSLALLGRHEESASDYFGLLSVEPENAKWKGCYEQQREKAIEGSDKG